MTTEQQQPKSDQTNAPSECDSCEHNQGAVSEKRVQCAAKSRSVNRAHKAACSKYQPVEEVKQAPPNPDPTGVRFPGCSACRHAEPEAEGENPRYVCAKTGGAYAKDEIGGCVDFEPRAESSVPSQEPDGTAAPGACEGAPTHDQKLLLPDDPDAIPDDPADTQRPRSPAEALLVILQDDRAFARVLELVDHLLKIFQKQEPTSEPCPTMALDFDAPPAPERTHQPEQLLDGRLSASVQCCADCIRYNALADRCEQLGPPFPPRELNSCSFFVPRPGPSYRENVERYLTWLGKRGA